MTEVDWTATTELAPKLEFLQSVSTARKLRLFACACCRLTWSYLKDKHIRKALKTAERFAEGDEPVRKLRTAQEEAWRAADVLRRREGASPTQSAASAVYHLCGDRIDWMLGAVLVAGRCVPDPEDSLQLLDARNRQIELLRDVFGNPFRPAVIEPAWLVWNGGTVVKLARAIYGDRRWENMPILGDALEDAMCYNTEMLEHCRGPGPHVRGCWVVDAILGKS